MPRKRITSPATDPSGFDVPPAADQPQPPSSIVDLPSSPQVPDAQLSTKNPQPSVKPSPVNATPLVIVPKQSFLRMQKLQTAKARQEQLRILARKHPVIRDLIKQLHKP